MPEMDPEVLLIVIVLALLISIPSLVPKMVPATLVIKTLLAALIFIPSPPLPKIDPLLF